jgi:hypothetical protein
LFHMKLQVTREASAPGINNALVDKENVEHACDEGATHDATNATSRESIPNFFGMSSSDGSKPAAKPIEASKGTKKDQGTKDDKTGRFNSLKETHPPTPVAVEHFTKLASQRKFQIKQVVQEPVPVDVKRHRSSKAKEKRSMHTRAIATETSTTLITATDKNLHKAVLFDPSESFADSLDNFFTDQYEQSVQINDVALFPAFETASNHQPSSIPQAQIHDQDVERPSQQQDQRQLCNDGQEKTILADLVFGDDKSQNWDAPGDIAGRSLQQSCEELVTAQWTPDVMYKDDESTNRSTIRHAEIRDQDVRRLNQHLGHIQICFDGRDKTSMADLVFADDKSHDCDAPVVDLGRNLQQSSEVPSMVHVATLSTPDITCEDSESTEARPDRQSSRQMSNVGQGKTILADEKSHNWDRPSVPSMEIALPQRMPDIICEDNDSMEAQLSEQPDRQVLKQDIVRRKTLADVVRNHIINRQSSDVSACSVVTETYSGVEISLQKQGVPSKKKRGKRNKKTTPTLMTNMNKEVKNTSKKTKNTGYSKKSLPRIIGKRVTAPTFNSLITDGAKERKKPMALVKHKKEGFGLLEITANDEIEEDSLTQATRLKAGCWKIEEESATLASTVTMDSIETSIRSSEYNTQGRWITVLEEVGLVCSNMLLCGIVEEETHGDDDFVLAGLNSDGSTIYSEIDSDTRCTTDIGNDSQDEYSKCYRQKSQSKDHKRKQGHGGCRSRRKVQGMKRMISRIEI